MSSLLLFLTLLCLSESACNARFLSIIVKEQDDLIIEDVGKGKIHKTLFQLGMGHSVLKNLRTQVQQEIGKDERKLYMHQEDESAMKQEKYSKAFLKEATASFSISGDIIVPSPNDLQRLAKKNQELQNSETRCLLESSPNENDEAVDSYKDDVVEDIVVMDYAQPHRKPPIHNEKP